MKLRPLHDNVLVQPLKGPEKTEGGLHIPTNAQEKQQVRGKVIAVGPGKVGDNGERLAIDVKDGDEVIYGKYAGTEIKVHNEDMKILKAEEIMAVVENE